MWRKLHQRHEFFTQYKHIAMVFLECGERPLSEYFKKYFTGKENYAKLCSWVIRLCEET